MSAGGERRAAAIDAASSMAKSSMPACGPHERVR
jgi:hypothetical protein